MKTLFLLRVLAFLFAGAVGLAAEWQWSVPMGSGRAFLWVPPSCTQVRAVMVGQNNMLEEGVLEHATMRATLDKLGIAEVFVAPPFDGPFNFNQGAGEKFLSIMQKLADESGYAELAVAPVIPIGHSACASYPWNFAAWNPGRTLALISLKGDAPQTNLTGYGGPNVEWGDREIDGIPALMVMGEYEWLDDRLAPALVFREKHPLAPIALLAEPGRGHFDLSEDLVSFLAMFVRKAAQNRLPSALTSSLRRHLSVPAPALLPVNPRLGWLVQRWSPDRGRTVAAAPVKTFKGSRADAFWCFDEEMAAATQNYRAHQFGKKPQLIGYVQDGKRVPQTKTHQQVNLRFLPAEDGVTLRFGAEFLELVEDGSPNLPRWTHLPVGSPLGHASAGGPIRLSRITGPVTQTGPDAFRIQYNRTASTSDRRQTDIWLLAEHPGDDEYKSAVQQALLKLPANTSGAEQRLTFPPIGARHAGAGTVILNATSDSGLPVSYYVREGPAEIDGSTLRFTGVPPRAKCPVKVTVVAWQFGRGTEPKVKAAASVEQTLLLLK